MKQPADPEELALVLKALTCEVNGCVEWDPDAADLVRRNTGELKGLTPEGIQEDVIQHAIRTQVVRQRKERRPQWQHREYYYFMIVPYPDLFKHGLFVEMELFDRDSEYPVVYLVNAHEERK